jgi:hypothetical protein
MQDMTIEEVVRKYLTFPFGSSGDGWNKIYCEVCGDGEGRTKGPRGGWLFNNEQAFYHCFNCNCNGSFDPEREFPYGKDMWKILTSFGIPKEEHQAIAYKNRLKDDKAFVKPVKKEAHVDIIKVPDHFYKLSEATPENIIAAKARTFLWDKKRILPTDYEFYLTTGISKEGPRELAIAKSLLNKIIIPYFKDGKMIYYQARGIDKKIYINASAPRTAIIYGYDKLHREIRRPLFITEGFWDAFHLDGVAVLENNMTSNQIEILSKSPRRKIVVPDRKDDTKKLASQAIELGWEVALPEIGGCDDVTDAILKYGKIYVLNSTMAHIFGGFEASVNLELY